MERTQIYLTPEQQRELERRVTSSGRTKSDLIREALDAYLGVGEPNEDWRRRWVAAVDAAYGAAPYLPATFVEDGRKLEVDRHEQLEGRWRT